MGHSLHVYIRSQIATRCNARFLGPHKLLDLRSVSLADRMMSLRYMSKVCLRAVQGLIKDRPWSSKAMSFGIKPSQTKNNMESAGKPSQFRWVSGGGDATKTAAMMEKSRQLREAEKADKIMHLVCWGPHLI
ncbi:hypothetical protein ACJRO7_006702 [Eucalyptus globulus]|uniref:Uncharacterized protein n=1 Tax=Eucalyptus globulus TaxID=34317 RepID=A0ABD3IIP8_EUCGL